MEKKKNTILLAGIVLAAAMAAGIFQTVFLKKEGACAVVQVQQKELYRLDLQKETEIMIKGGDGFNKIEIKDGAAAVKEADCPDKICVHTGAVRKTGEIIACLPHELTITISGADTEEDAMAH